MEARIIKLAKGVFAVEYRFSPTSAWQTLNKEFRTRPKAQAYIYGRFKIWVA